jgi:radical SAM superfamily enzyme YgiQ (UPF0313 family)
MLVRPRSRCGWGFMWAPLAINLEYIAANIENDVDEIMIVNQEFDDSDITQHIKKFNPDFFGVTMSATEHESGLALCKTAKKFGITTAVGGYHPTAIPDEMLNFPQVDFVFRGESEFTMKEFVKQGSAKNIDGISYRNNGKVIHNKSRKPIDNLDLLPFPARHYRKGDECDLWIKRGGSHRDQVHFSRGCWGRCTFCCEPSMSHSKQRYRTHESVFSEIEEVYKFHDEESLVIIFGDPHFMGKPKLIEPLCDLLIEADMNIVFTIMVRADSISKNPEIVKKMVKAGIIGYCMGLETPDLNGLNGTKKGINTKIQQNAVRILRDNHAVAGGTFVIGLPGQTEEEILSFPEYARNLGMINAAFAIATPQAGTEFHAELDEKGLIDIDDWTKYDQMHSVFKHDNIPRERLEQLLTHCIGRFYALDIFIDDMIEAQFRNTGGHKITLNGALHHFFDRVNFILNAGSQYRPDDGETHGQIFLQPQINPWTRLRTQKIGIHNMMHLKPFLKAFGNQKIQISLSNNGEKFIHYVLKTTKSEVEYLDICEEAHSDATLTLELDLSNLKEKKSKILLSMLHKIIKRNQLLTLIRGGIAGLIDHLAVTKAKKPTHHMILPSDYQNTGCTMDSWNWETYLKSKSSTDMSK